MSLHKTATLLGFQAAMARLYAALKDAITNLVGGRETCPRQEKGLAGKERPTKGQGHVERCGYPVQVWSIAGAIGVEKSGTFGDNVTWEVCEEDNITVEEAVCHHECLKIRALERGHIASGVNEVRRDGILLVVLVFVKVDVSKCCRACCR
jgi:hypothetical protein